MVLLKSINLGLRFILEICALTALGYWGFKTGYGMFLKILLGVGTPLVLAIIWGMFGSPAAPFKVGTPFRIYLELMIFGAAALALYASEKSSLAIIFLVITLFNKILMIVWEQ